MPDSSQPRLVLSAADSTHTLDVGTETTVADVKCAVQAAQGEAASDLCVLHSCAQTGQRVEPCGFCSAGHLFLELYTYSLSGMLYGQLLLYLQGCQWSAMSCVLCLLASSWRMLTCWQSAAWRMLLPCTF